MKKISEILKEEINNLINKYDFVILKGFPTTSLISLEKEYIFSDQLPLNKKNLIDLNLIEKNWINIFNNLNQNSQNLLLFESFTFISRNINLKLLEKKFVILENNVLDIYPNESTEIIDDYEKTLDEQKEINEKGLFTKFYSESFKIDNKYYVRYIDSLYDDYPNVDSVPFITKLSSFSTIPISENEIPNQAIVFSLSDYRVLTIKEKLFSDNPPNKVEFVISNSIINHPGSKDKLGILLGYLEKLGIGYQVFKIDNKLKTKYRTELDELLFQYWKSNSFRNLEIYSDPDLSKDVKAISQAIIVEEVIKQYEKGIHNNSSSDVFLTAPTGAGKSLLFQMPAIYLAQHYKAVTIVISPLIALMKDQVIAFKETRKFDNVAYINSELSLLDREEIIEDIKNGEISILYMSPELLLSYELKTFIGERQLGLFVIDEAHLVTTWGRDFRVDYWYLGNFIRKIRKYYDYHFVIMAVTATAVYQGAHDMVFETVNSLNMRNPILYIGKVRREEINFSINKLKIKGAHEEYKTSQTAKRIEEFLKKNKKSIVYCPWTSQISNIKNKLDAQYSDRVGVYFGRLDQYLKNDYQTKFKSGEIKSIIATKAFGMGVDINDIEIVYHHAPSGHLTDYVQEIGRLARKENLTGKAIVDFDRRDLKFTKILYGLSSIKQYQVSLVLKKLMNLYMINKKRNLLVSVSDFEYIFNFDNIDVEQKVKSSLLLLENDLLNKYKFNVLIARPKSLFTSVFIRVKNDHYLNFEKLFKDVIKKIKKDEKKGGHLYILELDKLWERKFSNLSFPVVKKMFFEKELFLEWDLSVTPQLRITLTLNDNKYETFKKLDKYFDIIHDCFSEFNGFFNKNDLINSLNKRFRDRIFSQRIANLFLSIYSGKTEAGKKFKMMEESFIQQKRENHEWFYRVINRAYPKVKAGVRRKYDKVFEDLKSNKTQTFIPATKNGLEKNRMLFKLAYMLETFDLGTYEIIGGEIPAIFIRINDPLKLERIVQQGYTNDILRNIEKRQKDSVEIMEYFFTNKISDDKRWELIEDYFLGRDLTTEELEQYKVS